MSSSQIIDVDLSNNRIQETSFDSHDDTTSDNDCSEKEQLHKNNITQQFMSHLTFLRKYITESSNDDGQLPTVAPAVNYQAHGPAYDAANGELNPELQRNEPYEAVTGETSTTIPEWNVHHGPMYNMVIIEE